MKGYLLVEVSGTRYGIRVEDVHQVVEVGAAHPAPSPHAAFRGVTEVAGRMVPLIELGAVLSGAAAGAAQEQMGVVAACAGKSVVLAVDAVEAVIREDPEPLPKGWRLPWAAAVARDGDGLIPIVDMQLLAERLAPADMSVRR